MTPSYTRTGLTALMAAEPRQLSARSRASLVTGPVDEDSDLWSFLRDQVLRGILGLSCERPWFHLQRLDPSCVLRCDEKRIPVSLALKSYDLKQLDGIEGRQGHDDQHKVRVGMLRREFDNIQRVRELGLDQPPLRAVRALTTNPDLGCLLVEEFADGKDISHAVREAVWYGRHAELSTRLTQVAAFLAQLHNASATNRRGIDHEAVTYLEKVIRQLAYLGVITYGQEEELRALERRWQASGGLCAPAEVLIHGDATPTQFLFPSDDELVVIDFEKLHYGDRAADIGRLAGELKHLFALYAWDAWASEPHIQHFYREYHRQASGAEDFGPLTQRARFYMGCSELRIARNSWMDLGHRHWLTREAVACLHR